MLWRRIDSAPIDRELLLYCPWRHESNRERIEIGYAHTSTGYGLSPWPTTASQRL